jgi:hypothetical protein
MRSSMDDDRGNLSGSYYRSGEDGRDEFAEEFIAPSHSIGPGGIIKCATAFKRPVKRRKAGLLV